MSMRQVERVIAGLWLTSLCGNGVCRANGGPPVAFYHEVGGDLTVVVPWALGIFCLTVVAEYLVVYCFVGWHENAGRKLFLWALVVNAITNPVMQCIFWFVPDLPPATQGVRELLVVVIEFGFWMWVFKRMYHHGELLRQVTALRTFMIAVVANVASVVCAWIGVPFLWYGLVSKMLPL